MEQKEGDKVLANVKIIVPSKESAREPAFGWNCEKSSDSFSNGFGSEMQHTKNAY
jgi:hypothetical protein